MSSRFNSWLETDHAPAVAAKAANGETYRLSTSDTTSYYNILIVSEGYASSEKAQFKADYERLLKTFTDADDQQYPLPSWMRRIFEKSRERQVDRLVKDLRFYVSEFSFTQSDESGIDEVKRKTFFEVSYTPHPWFSGKLNYSMLTGIGVYEKANALRRSVRDAYAARPLMHRVLILTNSSRRGAGHTGGALIVPGGYANSYELFEHELGHALGLGDEYFVKGEGITGVPPGDTDYPYPNVSKSAHGFIKDTNTSKAEGWLPEGDSFPGALYTMNAFRPAENCRMREADKHQFCKVCENHFVDFFTMRSGSPDFSHLKVIKPAPFDLVLRVPD